MKKHLTTILFLIALLIGRALLLYPTVSDWWNSFHSSRAISSYANAVSAIDDEEYESDFNENHY